MMKERLLQRVDELIEKGQAVLKTRHRDDDDAGELYGHAFGGPSRRELRGPESVDDGKMKEFRTASLSFIRNMYDDKHPHYLEFYRIGNGCDPGTVECSLGVLRAVRGEIDGDWLFTIKGLATAEVFTDYVEMAEYLLESGYKDASAVIAGSTLEEHLRQLCRNSGLPVTQKRDGKDVPLKADRLNNDLMTANVYSKLDHKNVTAWLDLRNKAAHGEYTGYNLDQVKVMIAGIIGFMTSVRV